MQSLVPGALVLDELSVLCIGKSADDLVFTVDGGALPLFMQATALLRFIDACRLPLLATFGHTVGCYARRSETWRRTVSIPSVMRVRGHAAEPPKAHMTESSRSFAITYDSCGSFRGAV
jgi:hypothetical protein